MNNKPDDLLGLVILISLCVKVSLFQETGPTLLYECDFDQDLCKGQILVNTNGILLQRAYSEYIITSNETLYFVTDVSSIIKPTSNGKPCSIPFNYSNTEFYQCTEEFKCLTAIDSQELSNCVKGQFLFSMSLEPSSSKFMFPLIDVPSSTSNNVIEISYYILMFCESCNISMRVLINDNEHVYNSDNYSNERAWAKYTVRLRVEGERKDLNVSIIFENLNLNVGYFGFDNLEVYQLNSDPQYSTEHISTLDYVNTTTIFDTTKNVSETLDFDTSLYTDYETTFEPSNSTLDTNHQRPDKKDSLLPLMLYIFVPLASLVLISIGGVLYYKKFRSNDNLDLTMIIIPDSELSDEHDSNNNNSNRYVLSEI